MNFNCNFCENKKPHKHDSRGRLFFLNNETQQITIPLPKESNNVIIEPCKSCSEPCIQCELHKKHITSLETDIEAIHLFFNESINQQHDIYKNLIEHYDHENQSLRKKTQELENDLKKKLEQIDEKIHKYEEDEKKEKILKENQKWDRLSKGKSLINNK